MYRFSQSARRTRLYDWNVRLVFLLIAAGALVTTWASVRYAEQPLIKAFGANVATTLGSVLLTSLVIDNILRRRAQAAVRGIQTQLCRRAFLTCVQWRLGYFLALIPHGMPVPADWKGKAEDWDRLERAAIERPTREQWDVLEPFFGEPLDKTIEELGAVLALGSDLPPDFREALMDELSKLRFAQRAFQSGAWLAKQEGTSAQSELVAASGGSIRAVLSSINRIAKAAESKM